MVVEQHDSDSVDFERDANDIAAGDERPGDRAYEDLALFQHALSRIEQDSAEMFLRFVGVPAHQSTADDGVVVASAIFAVARSDATGDLERRGDPRRFR